MKNPRVRFTWRWLMLALPLLAVALLVEYDRRPIVTEKQRERYLTRAGACRRTAKIFRKAYENGETNVVPYLHTMPAGATLPLVLKWAQHYEDLTRKYELAASQPWEPLAPDPPPPEVIPPFPD